MGCQENDDVLELRPGSARTTSVDSDMSSTVASNFSCHGLYPYHIELVISFCPLPLMISPIDTRLYSSGVGCEMS